MSLNDILLTLQKIKPKYTPEGLDILGIFGSYARNEANQNSDIDILIETKNSFLANYPDGLSAFSRLADIKSELEDIFKTKVDLIDKTGLIQHNNTHILKSTIYV